MWQNSHLSSKWGDLSLENDSKTNKAQKGVLLCMCIVNTMLKLTSVEVTALVQTPYTISSNILNPAVYLPVTNCCEKLFF